MSADYRVAAKAVKFEKPVSALNKLINQGAFLFALRDVTQRMGPKLAVHDVLCSRPGQRA